MVGEIVRQRQQTVAEVTSRIIEDWIDSNYDFLVSRYQVSLEDFDQALEEAAKEAERKASEASARARSNRKNPSLTDK